MREATEFENYFSDDPQCAFAAAHELIQIVTC